ncbi:hypothetical protein H6G82_26655 [Planktothricoides sp. FACHB-1261]|nr:hypothetical protein [Planktothricoides raciborskii FACHB-1261]
MAARKKPGFWGSGGGCWGKETGFLLWVSGVICGSEKETRFLVMLPLKRAKHDRI